MSRRALTPLAALMVMAVTGAFAGIARADCVDTPLTVTFDAGAGTPQCYTEAGMTVCAFEVFAPDVQLPGMLALGDNDGDTSPDLMNHDIGGSGPLTYTFSMGGAPFAVTGFNFTHFSGTHTFTSTKGSFNLYDSELVASDTLDPAEWSGITSFTWTVSGGTDPGGVMDTLDIVAQCCGNGVVDAGEQCDDGNTLDGDCCSATCQLDASGTFCEADGDICTDDVCDGAGTCTHPVFPNCQVTRPCGPTRPAGNPMFGHPKKATQFKTNLVQAFVACGDIGGNSPNATTEGGIPACSPPQTPNERAGSPTNGWRWDPLKGQGQIQLKRACRGADDAVVKLNLAGVVDGTGAPANGQGALALRLQMTLDDPVSGDMTAVPISGQIPVSLLNGDGALVTTVGIILSESGMPELANGTSMEVLDVEVLDPNGNLFGHPGTFLP